MADKWKWMDDAFKRLAYWMGYQGIRFARHPLRGIAAVTELVCLLIGRARGKGLMIECEKSFSRILGSEALVPDKYRQKRVDLIFMAKDDSAARLAMEVKVADGKIPFRKSAGWQEDLKRLYWLKS